MSIKKNSHLTKTEHLAKKIYAFVNGYPLQ